MKIISLLKAVLSQDMNMFKYTVKPNSSRIRKAMFPIFLFSLVSLSIGLYAYKLAEILAPLKLTFIMLSMFIAMVTILAFIEGIYKSQGILFEAKDNDLLFSLPLKKRTILFAKIFKLILFEYLYNLMFILPAFIVYIIFEHPGLNFYFITIIMTLLIPIIPTVISCVIGYIIKLVSTKSNKKRIVQTILTSLVFIGFMFLSFNSQSVVEEITKNANSINDLLTKLYYPIGAYISLIDKFDFITFLKLIFINIGVLVLFILIGEKYYFKIISSSKNSDTSKKKSKKATIERRSKLHSLTLKELRRYLSSPVYMFNTSFGLLLLLILSAVLAIKGKLFIVNLLSSYGLSDSISINLLYYGIVFFSLCATSITSSSISLEGKTINITKSLPVDYLTIFKSKILTCFIIELPFAIAGEVMFIIRFGINPIYIIELTLLMIITIFLTAVIGLIINLKYPKLNASDDTEVVKQSMSSMISVFIGFGLFLVSILGIGYFIKRIDFEILLLAQLVILAIMSLITYLVLIRKGAIEYQKLNV